MRSHLIVVLMVLILTPFVYGAQINVGSVSHHCSTEPDDRGAMITKCNYKLMDQEGKTYTSTNGSLNMSGVNQDYLDLLIFTKGMEPGKTIRFKVPSRSGSSVSYESVQGQIQAIVSQDRCGAVRRAYESITQDYNAKKSKLFDASKAAQCGGITESATTTRSQPSPTRRGTRQ